MPPLSVTLKRRKQERLECAWNGILEQQQAEGTSKTTDTHLMCADGCVPVHGPVLAEASVLFKEVFTSQGNNYLGVRTVILPEFKVREIYFLVQFVYYGFVNISSLEDAETLKDLLSFFQVHVPKISVDSSGDVDTRAILYYQDDDEKMDDVSLTLGRNQIMPPTQDLENSTMGSVDHDSGTDQDEEENESVATKEAVAPTAKSDSMPKAVSEEKRDSLSNATIRTKLMERLKSIVDGNAPVPPKAENTFPEAVVGIGKPKPPLSSTNDVSTTKMDSPSKSSNYEKRDEDEGKEKEVVITRPASNRGLRVRPLLKRTVDPDSDGSEHQNSSEEESSPIKKRGKTSRGLSPDDSKTTRSNRSSTRNSIARGSPRASKESHDGAEVVEKTRTTKKDLKTPSPAAGRCTRRSNSSARTPSNEVDDPNFDLKEHDGDGGKTPRSQGRSVNKVRANDETPAQEIYEKEVPADFYQDFEKLYNSGLKCFVCGKKYSTPMEASACITDNHQMVRCYLCFSVARTTMGLYDHYRKKHQKNSRENTVVCPFPDCHQVLTFRAISTHCLAVHITKKKSASGTPEAPTVTNPNDASKADQTCKTQQKSSLPSQIGVMTVVGEKRVIAKTQPEQGELLITRDNGSGKQICYKMKY